MSKLFSACGKLVGHYPIAGWLRTTCNYMKRRVEVIGWEDRVDGQIIAVMWEVIEEVQQHNPVQEKSHVPKSEKGIV